MIIGQQIANIHHMMIFKVPYELYDIVWAILYGLYYFTSFRPMIVIIFNGSPSENPDIKSR